MNKEESDRDKEERYLYYKSLEILQNEHRRIFVYIVNLFIALSSGALALMINLLASDNFEKSVIYPYCEALIFLATSLIFLATSLISGVIFVCCYLHNIKLAIVEANWTVAKEKSQHHVEIVSEKRSKSSKVLRCLVRFQILSFTLGGLSLLVAVVLQRLIPIF